MFHMIDKIIQLDDEALKELIERYKDSENFNSQLIADCCKKELELRGQG